MGDQIGDEFGGLWLDDSQSENDEPVLTSREKRIAAAVKRSKSTYRSEQAFTEAGHYAPMISPLDGSASYGRHIEYMAVQLYFAAEYEQCIDLCRAIHLGSGLDREMADLNLRAALKAGSTRDVLDVVEESRQWWRGTPGLANTAAAVYRQEARFADALSACLYSVNERGLSTEPLKELSSIIKAWGAQSDISEALREALMQLSLVHSLASRDASDHLASEVSNPEIVLTSQPNSADDGVSRIATILWGAESSANEELLRAFVKRVFALSRSLPTDSVPDRSVRTL